MAGDGQPRTAAEERVEARPDQLEAVAGRQVRSVEPGTVIRHRQTDAAVERGSGHDDRTAFPARRHGVLYTVLDQCLQRQRRHANLGERLVETDVVAQARSEPDALDLQVVADDLQLLLERYHRVGRRVE